MLARRVDRRGGLRCHRIRHHADFLARVAVIAGNFLAREITDGDQRLDPLEQQRRKAFVEAAESTRIALRVADVGNVMMRGNLVAVDQRRGVTQRQQWRMPVTRQPQRQIKLLPEVPTITADAAHLQTFGAGARMDVVRGDECQVFAHGSKLQTDLFGKTLYAAGFLSQETSVDHNHERLSLREGASFSEARMTRGHCAAGEQRRRVKAEWSAP